MAPDPMSMTASARRTRYDIHLYLRGGDLDPQAVAAVFGVALDGQHHKAGDIFLLDGERVARPDGFCVIASSPTVPREAPFETHVGWFLDRIEPHLEKIREWQAAGWDIRIAIVTATNRKSGGPHVEPHTLKRMANLGLATRWVTGFQE